MINKIAMVEVCVHVVGCRWCWCGDFLKIYKEGYDDSGGVLMVCSPIREFRISKIHPLFMLYSTPTIPIN